MNLQEAKTHAYALLMSFLGAVATAAGIAALQWTGAHIPDATQFLLTIAGGAGGMKAGGAV